MAQLQRNGNDSNGRCDDMAMDGTWQHNRDRRHNGNATVMASMISEMAAAMDAGQQQ
jgi:hypothetical protein